MLPARAPFERFDRAIPVAIQHGIELAGEVRVEGWTGSSGSRPVDHFDRAFGQRSVASYAAQRKARESRWRSACGAISTDSANGVVDAPCVGPVRPDGDGMDAQPAELALSSLHSELRELGGGRVWIREAARSGPGTWVTLMSKDMGDSFRPGRGAEAVCYGDGLAPKTSRE